MKTFISLLIALMSVLVSVSAIAQAKPATGYAEYQGAFKKTKPVEHMLDLYVEKQAWNKFGVSAFTLVAKDWAEAYAGPTFAPGEWISMGLSLGAQQIEGRMGVRYAASLWLGGGKKLPLEFLGVFEGDETATKDRSGLWYDAKAMYSPFSWLSLGIHGRRSIGIGPRLEVTIPAPNLPLTVWATWNPYDPESKDEHASLARGLVGAKATF
jgi:hypothetical protein